MTFDSLKEFFDIKNEAQSHISTFIDRGIGRFWRQVTWNHELDGI
jgi:hypothetical protein